MDLNGNRSSNCEVDGTCSGSCLVDSCKTFGIDCHTFRLVDKMQGSRRVYPKVSGLSHNEIYA